MSSAGNVNQKTQQLQQDLQNELFNTNQLLRLISVELEQIKHLTSAGGEFEANIQQNASLIKTLAKIQQIDVNNLPPIARQHLDVSMQQQNNTIRNESEMDESQ